MWLIVAKLHLPKKLNKGHNSLNFLQIILELNSRNHILGFYHPSKKRKRSEHNYSSHRVNRQTHRHKDTQGENIQLTIGSLYQSYSSHHVNRQTHRHTRRKYTTHNIIVLRIKQGRCTLHRGIARTTKPTYKRGKTFLCRMSKRFHNQTDSYRMFSF